MAHVHLVVVVLQHFVFSSTSGFYGFQNHVPAKLNPPSDGFSSAPIEGIGAGAGVFQPFVSSTLNGLPSSKPTHSASSGPTAVNGFHFTNDNTQSSMATGLKEPPKLSSVLGFSGKPHKLIPEEFEKTHNAPSLGALFVPTISSSLNEPHGFLGFPSGFSFFSNTGLPKTHDEGPRPVSQTTTPPRSTTTPSITTIPTTTTATTTNADPPTTPTVTATTTAAPATTTTNPTTATTTTSTAPPTTPSATTTTPATTTTIPTTTTTTTSTAPPTSPTATTTTPATTTTIPTTTTTTTSTAPPTTPTATITTTTTPTTTTTTSKKEVRRDPLCPKKFTFSGGLCFNIHSRPQQHEQAARTCRKGGANGRLAILNTEKKFEALRARLSSANTAAPYWVGLKSPFDGRMTWDDNSSVNRSFWAPGEPNNRNEKCGDMRKDLKYKLNDVPCSPFKFRFVCEIPL